MTWVPILTAYRLEWNKLHETLSQSDLGAAGWLPAADDDGSPPAVDPTELGRIFGRMRALSPR